MTTPDAEYTDWSDLARFVDEFLAATQPGGMKGAEELQAKKLSQPNASPGRYKGP